MREVSIAAKPTASDPHHPASDDAQASLRTELLGQLVAAEFELETVLADLTRGDVESSAIAGVRSQLQSLGSLRQQLATADARTLVAMRASIASAINAGQAAVDQAHVDRDSANASTLSNYAQGARNVVNETMRGLKDFEQDLRFANAQDEADYRRREDERRAIIAAEQAKNTPEGDLNASAAAMGQMADAAAHGAARNPAFQKRWDALVESTTRLREQIVRDGGNVAEFDKRLREDLRRIMHAKGVPDAQIDALFTANPGNPLEAAKAFVAEQSGVIGDKDIGELSRRAANYRDDAEVPPPTPPSAAPETSMVDAFAKFKATGVTVAEDNSSQPTSGLAARAVADRGSSRVPT